MDKKRIIKFAICFFISAIIWCTVSKCFATTNEWDLSYEKETYKDIANLYNMPVDENDTLYGSIGFSKNYTLPDFFTTTFINNFFADVENRLENSTYTQEEYPNIVISTSKDLIQFIISKQIDGFSGDSIHLNYFIIFTYNYSTTNGFTFNSSTEYLTGNYSRFLGFCPYTGGSSYLGLRTFLLSNVADLEYYYNYNVNYAPYGDRTNFAEVIIQENQVKIDPTKTYDNNILLNIDIINGKFINYEYQIYYLENEQKVYITDNINYLTNDLRYGTLKGFYISPDYVSQLPNNTQFYIDVIFHINKTYTTSILSDNTLPAFETGAISSGGTGDSGGGGSEGGGDTGGSSVNLENIENTLGDINTSIIETGQQTNQNLNEIKEAINQTNEFIIQEPTTSDDEFLNSFPTVEIDDPSEDFFTWIFENIENIFLSTEEQEFQFSLYTDAVYTVSSNQITVPDSTIKTLVGLSVNFGICYWILKDVRKTINKVKEGNIEALSDEDITANMV